MADEPRGAGGTSLTASPPTMSAPQGEKHRLVTKERRWQCNDQEKNVRLQNIGCYLVIRMQKLSRFHRQFCGTSNVLIIIITYEINHYVSKRH